MSGHVKVNRSHLQSQLDILYQMKDADVLLMPLILRNAKNKRTIRKAVTQLVDKGVLQRIEVEAELKSDDGHYIPIRHGYTADKVEVILEIGRINDSLLR